MVSRLRGGDEALLSIQSGSAGANQEVGRETLASRAFLFEREKESKPIFGDPGGEVGGNWWLECSERRGVSLTLSASEFAFRLASSVAVCVVGFGVWWAQRVCQTLGQQ